MVWISEFLEGFDGGLDDLNVHASEAVRVRRVVDAIELEGVLKGPVAVDVEDTFKTDGLETRGGGEDAGGEQRELVVVAAVEGELDHLGAVDDGAAAGGLGVEDRALGGDVDLLGDCADGELDVEAGGLVDLEDDVRGDGLLESLRGRGDPVQAGAEAWEDVAAFGVGDDGRLDVGLGVGDADGGVGDERRRQGRSRRR